MEYFLAVTIPLWFPLVMVWCLVDLVVWLATGRRE